MKDYFLCTVFVPVVKVWWLYNQKHQSLQYILPRYSQEFSITVDIWNQVGRSFFKDLLKRIVRQYENGFQEGHFTIEVVMDELSYATHQATTPDRSRSTIVRAGQFNSNHAHVHEAIIQLPDAQAAINYQKALINEELGHYDPINNSCLSHVIDVIDARKGVKYNKSEMGYGRFCGKNGFKRLAACIK